MAKYTNGVNGSFQGTVGSVVGASWKNISYMKGKRKAGTFKPSKEQLEQQAKFAFLVKFIAPLGKLFELTFNDKGIKMTGINNAFRYNFRNAVTGTFPSFSLNYPKVMVSKGGLHPADDPKAEAAGGGIVKFTWADNSGANYANPTDSSILVVHCPELDRTIYMDNADPRSAETAIIKAGIFKGKTVETWLAFISQNGMDASPSSYTGQLIVS